MDYYEALQEKENDLRVSLTILNQSIAHLNQTMAQINNNVDLKIVALSDTLADETNLIGDLQREHVLPLTLKSINCTNISQEDLQQIQASIQQIQADLNEIENRINELDNAQ